MILKLDGATDHNVNFFAWRPDAASHLERMEKGLRRIESAVREADDTRWARTNPEVAARAQSMVTQLETSVASLREDVAKAEASGNAKKVADAQAKLEAQEQWLEQARGNLDEFSG